MKKGVIIFILGLLICNSAFARPVVVAARGSHRKENNEVVSVSIDKLVGKTIKGCKILTAYFDGYNRSIFSLCEKDGKLYRMATYIDSFHYVCENMFCTGINDLTIEEEITRALKEESER